ncbi:E3 SUMO-protein ligase KIAA1586-like [Aphis craccivora]|uniref:E3 SUMO-protein ligase KIAA1586-like n=1 Tax=Aphis craccivora TaxID=307492 RepID=A0A6G0Y5W1_APHCR|nr:E3 SUMO-protein ligase KIAA1586-like [Aphis craccivora]
MFPNLIIWHCSNHHLDLAVNDVVNEVDGINHFKIFMDK